MASLLGTAVSAATKAATTAAKNVSKTVKEKKDKTSSVNNALSGSSNVASGNSNVAPSNGYTATGSYNDASMQEYNQTDYSKILQAQDAYKQAYAKGDSRNDGSTQLSRINS